MMPSARSLSLSLLSLLGGPLLVLSDAAVARAQEGRAAPAAGAIGAPRVDPDAPNAVRFGFLETWSPMASVLSGPVKLRVGGTAPTVRVAPTDELLVPVSLDPTPAGVSIGAISATIGWDPQRLTLVRVDTGALPGLTANLAAATSGSVTLGLVSAQGSPSAVTIATLVFTASATYGGTSIRLAPSVLADPTGASLLRAAEIRQAAACVAPTGKWGDVNGDDAVNIIDAQQISRASIGLGVARAPLVLAQGDVNGADGVNIIDALQVARFAIQLSAPARIGQAAFEVPAISGVTVTPGVGEIGIGERRALVASPTSTAGTAVDGCLPTTWSSSVPEIATVDADGVVTAVAAGTVTITATTGTRVAATTVTVINRAVKVASLELVEGPEIATYPNVQTGQPVRVKAVNEAGQPLAGVAVTFSVASGAALVGPTTVRRSTGASAVPLTVVTDASGIAIVRVWGGTQALATGAVTVSTAGAPERTMSVATLPWRIGGSICVGDGWGRRCWGDGSRGQLGNGSFAGSATPVSVVTTGITFGPTSVITTENFGDHTCVTDANGGAWCWGSNTGGQLGDGTFENRATPVRVVTGKAFVDLVAGSEHSCGLTSAATGGEIWCWGYNWSGQLGDGTIGNRRAVPVKVVAPNGQPFTALTAGTNFTCGRIGTSAWYCWGLNSAGQLGDGTTTSRELPVAVPGSFEQVDAGENQACGRTAYNAQDGSGGVLSCWGDGQVGALGDGRFRASDYQLTPVPVRNGTGFRDVQMGYYRGCARKGDDAVFCWGYNMDGQLGDGARLNRAEPTLIPFTGRQLILSGTSLSTSGQSTCGQTPTSRQVFCWGSNLGGKLGTGGTTGEPVTTPELVPRPGATVAAAAALGYAYPIGGLLSVKASSSPNGALAIGVADALGNPVAGRTVTFTVRSGSARFPGDATSSSGTTDGVGTVTSAGLVWPTPGAGVIDVSTTVRTPGGQDATETFVVPYVVTAAPGAVEVVSGQDAWIGGINDYRVPIRVRVLDGGTTPAPIANAEVNFYVQSGGALEDGSSFARILTDANGVALFDTELLTFADTVLQVSAGVSGLSPQVITLHRSPMTIVAVPGTSCELQQGTVYCWGSDTYGAVGRGGTVRSTVTSPTAITAVTGFTALADGVSAHKCGLVGTTAYCWGMNDAGQLGDGTYVDRAVPTPVSTTILFTALATGGNTTCGLSTAGNLHCWGWSGSGGFGGSPAAVGQAFTTPQLIADAPAGITKVVVADDAVCVLTQPGALHCRGDGSKGWNLDGTIVQRTTFTVAAGGPWKDVSAAYLGLCAIGQDDRIRCAGDDQSVGALGSGTEIPGIRNTLVGGEVAGGRSFAKVHVYPFGGCGIELQTSDVYCWGNSNWGQAGVGTFTSSLAPARVAGLRAATLRPQAFRTNCATAGVTAAAGTLYCWGDNRSGAVGVGSTATSGFSTPTIVPGWLGTPSGATVAVELRHIAAAPASGTAFVADSVRPPPSVLAVNKAGGPVAGVTVSFTVTAGGGRVGQATAVTGTDGIASPLAWVLGPEAGVTNTLVAAVDGLPSRTFTYGALSSAQPASIAAVGSTIQYGIKFDRTSRNPLQVVVRDAQGRPLANVPVIYRIPANAGCLQASPSPCSIAGATSASVATDAFGIASAPKPSGSTDANWFTPDQVNTFELEAVVAGLAPVTFTLLKRDFYGGNNTCRLHTDGRAFCWGSTAAGALGTSVNLAQSTQLPLQVANIPAFTSLAEGGASEHNCGIVPGGAAWCWGNNQTGALGNGTLTNSAVPVPVAGGLTFTRLFKGMGATCGITTSGALYCWGWGSRSRYGDGDWANIKLVPTLVNTNGLSFVEVELALEATCGRTQAGTVHCWSDASYMLGDGGAARTAPSPIGIPSVIASQLSAGDRGFCATLTDAGVRCWGEAGKGQLGDGVDRGSTGASLTPVIPIGLASGVREVRHSSWLAVCALKLDGSVLCWGENGSGQLGNGVTPATTLTRVPTLITTSASGVPVVGTRFQPAGAQAAFCVERSGDQSYCWGQTPVSGTAANSSIPTVVILAP